MTGYIDCGYLVHRGLLSIELTDFLSKQLQMIRRVDSSGGGDSQVPVSYSIYGSIAFETLMCNLAPTLSKILRVSLAPTYSYARIYDRGATLAPHKDRAACENSVTITLGYEAPTSWPIWIEDKKGNVTSIALEPGDALIYRGCECKHWREKFSDGEWQAQVFLHYVDEHGPRASEIFDGRPFPGFKNALLKRDQHAPQIIREALEP